MLDNTLLNLPKKKKLPEFPYFIINWANSEVEPLNMILAVMNSYTKG